MSDPTHQPAVTERLRALSGYVASIVLGAGIFTLPFEVATIGALPLIAMLALMALAALWLFPRTLADNYAPGTVGPLPLSAAVVAAGAGTAGRALAFSCAVLQVLPAATGYMVLGLAGLDQLEQVVRRADEPALAGLAIAAICQAGYLASPTSRVPEQVRSASALGSRWFLGIALSLAFGFDGYTRIAVLAAGLIAGVKFLLSNEPPPQRAASHGPSTSDLCDAHRRSVLALRVELLLMGSMAIVAVGLAVGSGAAKVPTLVGNPSASDIAQAVGVTVFAYTAAGLTNTSGYGAMRSPRGRRRVSRSAIRAVWLCQLAWIVGVGVVVADDELLRLSAAGSYTTVGLTDSVAMVTPTLSVALSVSAGLILLFAVSVGCASTAELLGRETGIVLTNAGWMRRISRSPSPFANLAHPANLQHAVLVVAATGAGLVVVSGVSVNAVLTIAGLNGGTVLLFVLPLLGNRQRSTARWHSGLALAIALLAATMGVVVASGRPQTALAVASGFVISSLTMASWATQSGVRTFCAATPIETPPPGSRQPASPTRVEL